MFCLSLNKRRDVVVYSVFEYTNRIYIIFVLQIRNEVIILGRKPLRECGKAGCHELTRDYYCDKHKVNRHKVYDKEQRNFIIQKNGKRLEPKQCQRRMAYVKTV